jgi:hypothetical protein
MPQAINVSTRMTAVVGSSSKAGDAAEISPNGPLLGARAAGVSQHVPWMIEFRPRMQQSTHLHHCVSVEAIVGHGRSSVSFRFEDETGIRKGATGFNPQSKKITHDDDAVRPRHR